MRFPRARRRLAVLTALALATAMGAASIPGPPGDHNYDKNSGLPIGAAAPDFLLPGIDGKTHRLSDYRDAKILMIAFLSNHCPDSHASAPRIIAFAREYAARGVAVVAINPNNPDAVAIDELGYSAYTDSFADMGRYAADVGLPFPYLWDGSTQKTAVAYGCLSTPDIFIFDAERRLRYKGEFDNSHYADPSTVTTQDARAAVDALLAGRAVPVPVTPPHGCSTKWIAKKAAIARQLVKWRETPVDLEKIDLAAAQALKENRLDRLRLINVWATWCAPCVEEFPALVNTIRRFSQRPIDVVTISVDDPDHAPQVKAFLEKEGAGIPAAARAAVALDDRRTNSYLYTEPDMGKLVQALDPDWPGALPDTVLLAADGTVLWRHNGPATEAEMLSEILKVLGTYFVPGSGR